MYGKSTFITPTPAGFVAAAEFYDFAPNSCICHQPCVGEDQRKRTYAHVYENKLEVSSPIAPFCCLTTEVCMLDNISVMYFDKRMTNTGLSCGVVPLGLCYSCIPLSCFGRPVVFVSTPKFLCIDMKTCFGQSVKSAPCNCFDLKLFICCGNPCYTLCSVPVVNGVGNADQFASALKYAVDAYGKRTQIPETRMPIFAKVEDNIFDIGKAKGLQELKMARK